MQLGSNQGAIVLKDLRRPSLTFPAACMHPCSPLVCSFLALVDRLDGVSRMYKDRLDQKVMHLALYSGSLRHAVRRIPNRMLCSCFAFLEE